MRRGRRWPQLLRTALRMRPDRLVLGEVRGAEAVQLVQAMNTGHDGSMATVHANSAIDAVARVCSLVLQEVPGWPLEAIHDQVRRSIDVVIHVGRTSEQAAAGDRGVRVRPDAATGVRLRRLAERRRSCSARCSGAGDDDGAVAWCAGRCSIAALRRQRSAIAASDAVTHTPTR